MARRIVILGGPHTGKSTLSERLQKELGIETLHTSAELESLFPVDRPESWSQHSEHASKWFDDPGDWICEGVQMARALRKWLRVNPEAELDIDILTLSEPFDELLPGQESMAKGVFTVFREIEQQLINRGARVHNLEAAYKAIGLFSETNPEESGNRRTEVHMLKSTYKTLDEIPEGDRQHYKKIGDRHVLELDGEHPVQVQNSTLVREKKEEVQAANTRAATAEAEANRLKTQMETQPTLPSGHVAVPADEARLLDTVKELGEGADTKAKVESVKTRLTAYPTLETKVATLEKEGLLRKVADSGIGGKRLNLKRLELLDKDAGGLTYEERDVNITENGKSRTEKAWHVKDGNKWVTLSEYSDTHWKDLGIPLTDEQATPGTRVIGQRADDPSKPAGNLYDDIRKQAADAQKQQIESTPLEKRLHMA